MLLPTRAGSGSRPAGVRRRVTLIGLATAATTVAALTAGGTAWAAPQDEGAIRGSAVHAVPNSYVVVLKDSTVKAQGVDTAAKTLSDRFGGKVSHTYSHALHGFAVKDLSETQARKLAADPAVAYVQQDAVTHAASTKTHASSTQIHASSTQIHASSTQIHASSTQSGAPWDLDRIDQHYGLNGTYTYPTTAPNVHGYVIDTGIQITHPEFGGRASYGIDEITGDSNADDCGGEGTEVAGILGGTTYGVAKGVQLVAVRVLDCQFGGYFSDIIAGVDWVTANAVKPAVADLSVFSDPYPALDAAVQRSIDSGITYSLPAGDGDANFNPQDACTVSPARVPGALTVAAMDSSDQRSWFSNYGGCVDLFAPGEYIPTSLAGNSYTGNIGTTFSAPLVAGAAALILSAHPDYTPAQVSAALTTDSATPGAVGDPGPGSPNRLLYVRNVEPPVLASKQATLYNPKYGTTEVYARSSAGHLVYKYYYNGWSEWTDLGGDDVGGIVGDPAVIYNPTYGTTEVYARNSAGHTVYKYYYNGWSGWNDLGGDAASNPAVIYNPTYGTTEVYTRTSANTVVYRYYYNGWSGWNDLGGDTTGNPAVLYNPKYGTTEVYTRTSANTVVYKYYYNGWSGWNGLGGGGDVAGDPALLYNPKYGTTEVYTRTSTGRLTYRYFYNGWSGWNDLGVNNLGGDPTTLYNPKYGTTEVYARNTNGQAVYQYYYNGWSSQTNLGGDLATAPGLLYNPQYGDTEIYTSNSAGHSVYQFYYNGWSGWADLSL